MKFKFPRLFRAAGLLVMLCATLSTGAEEGAKKEKKAARPDPMTEDLKGRQGTEFENAFLAHMIHHHEGGIEMAKLAQERAESAEVKAMAEKMIPTQTKEIEQMTGWLKEWGQKTPADYPMPPQSVKKMERDMAKLKEAKGAEFDQMFLRQMMVHHRGGVAMAELVPGKTERAELKELAAKIAEVQGKEIREMRKMRKE